MSYYTPPPSDAGGYPQASPPPPNNLVWAILTTIFCCLPAGVVSIVFAAQVNSKWQAGDYQGAMSASKNAKTWAIVAAVAGLIFSAIYAVFLLVASSNSTY
ncbi:CD225/dispanin family protein [Actinomadura sp. 9N407]|uniref:CD225/dispanin family protein n=1 Tax=Actinomadura sp. 9N407 TaxID=3375154 RepID=UPI0037B62F13